MRNYILGVDWGGTRIKLGAVRMDGSLLAHEIISPHNSATLEEAYSAVVRQLRLFIERFGPPLGIGLGLTGIIDPEVGVVLLPGKIKGLEGFPIVSRLRTEFLIPVWADNDGRVAMYAEKYIGQARGRSWAVTLTIGTGVGSGVMLDGKILNDPHLQFGTQAGHLVIDLSHDQLCLTGARGTAEMLCSATALVLSVHSGLQRGIPSTLNDLYWSDPHRVDFRAIVDDGITQGDRLCLDELRRWVVRVGWLLVSVVHAYSPQVVILSGGAVAASRFFIDELRAHVSTHVFRYPPGEPVPILISELGDHIGVIGAALMVKERLMTKERLDANPQAE
jgi:glucokinase